jgi:hypothetical protein
VCRYSYSFVSDWATDGELSWYLVEIGVGGGGAVADNSEALRCWRTPYHPLQSEQEHWLRTFSAQCSVVQNSGTNTGHFSRAMKSTSFREGVTRSVTEYGNPLLQSPSHHKNHCFFIHCIFVFRSVYTLWRNAHILTMEFTVDLDSVLRWGKASVPCLWPVTDVLQLKIDLADVQSCFVRVI